LSELKRRLRIYTAEHLAAREPERVLRIHAELPLDRITPVLAGWLRKLEPLGHGNPEPIFFARSAQLLAPPRIMKERHLCLELAQASGPSSDGASAQQQGSASPVSSIRAIGWGLADRVSLLGLAKGSAVDVAYRIRENDHPDYGGLEIEIMGIQPATAEPTI
jgi:single-stranded-DNA-specific exonuclease